MNKFYALLMTSAITLTLAGCTATEKVSETTTEAFGEATKANGTANEDNVIPEQDLIDTEVIIDENIRFLEMNPAEKAKKYDEYNHIDKNSLTEVVATELSQVEEITSEEAYNELIEKSKTEAVVLYVGFDECPYCRADIPKLNHLAKELDVTLHYYNTNRRVDDNNFKDVIQFLNIETVPHAFIIQDGEIKALINHTNTMQDMEDFLKEVVELNK